MGGFVSNIEQQQKEMYGDEYLTNITLKITGKVTYEEIVDFKLPYVSAFDPVEPVKKPEPVIYSERSNSNIESLLANLKR